MDEHRHLEAMGLIIHTAIIVLNLVALLHNLKKRNWKQAGIHFSVVCYEVSAAYEHWKDLRHDG